MREEMDGAAALGVELFVVDAGWYVGRRRERRLRLRVRASATWQVDPARFPEACGALTDYAHELGMKFGIWVEPERVALSTVGRSGSRRNRGSRRTAASYGSAQTGADLPRRARPARQWVLDAGHARSSTRCSPTI